MINIMIRIKSRTITCIRLCYTSLKYTANKNNNIHLNIFKSAAQFLKDLMMAQLTLNFLESANIYCVKCL